MLRGKDQVAEIGCGDGFGSRSVRQTVRNLIITNHDAYFIRKFNQQACEQWQTEAKIYDILTAPLFIEMDVIYSLDVLEHLSPELGSIFLENICLSLKKRLHHYCYTQSRIPNLCITRKSRRTLKLQKWDDVSDPVITVF